MKFQEFFEKNRKLLKLNFVLLGTLIFFLGLQFANVCYAATEDEILNSGKTIAEWTEDVLTHYGVLDNNLPYIVFKSYNTSLSANEYKIHVFPDLTTDYVLLFNIKDGRFGVNFTKNRDINTLQANDFLLTSTSTGLNVWVLDNIATAYSVSKDFKYGVLMNGQRFNNGSANAFTVLYAYQLGNLQNVSGGLTYTAGVNRVIYTNFKEFYDGSEYVTKVLDSIGKELNVVDYEDFIYYENDNIGDYIKLDSLLKETDVTNIVFEGANLMSGISKYQITTDVNFDYAKVYVNDSSTVKIIFKDTGGNVLYTTTKHYDSVNQEELAELFDYDFDVSNSLTAEFNGVWFYKDIDFYIKYNNIYDYVTEPFVGQHVYVPVISYDFVFDSGDVISTNKFYFTFDQTYFLNLPGPLSIIDSLDKDEAFTKFSDLISWKLYYDFVELVNAGDLYSIRINMAVEQYYVDATENYNYVSTVHKRSVIQNFSTKQNVSVGSVVELQDSDKNDIGFVVIDGNGEIISSSLNEGYTADSKYVYDSNNNVVYTFNSNDNGWHLLDKDGVVIKEHTNVTLEDKIQDANNRDTIDVGFADTINTIASTITGSLSALLTSVSGIAALFGSAFSWLPEPIPQLVVFVFSAMAIFALIRFIRGH